MKTRERVVHFYDLILSSHTRTSDVKSPSCARLSEVLTALKKQASLPVEVQRQKTSLSTLDDWDYDRAAGVHALLFNRADTAVSDVSFRHVKSRALRKGNKVKDEGIEISMHALVRPNADGRTALVVVTMGAGVSAGAIEVALGRLSRQAAEDTRNKALFNFPHPSGEKDGKGNAVTYSVRYEFECVAHKGMLLERALSTGEFVEMELIEHATSKFDQGGNLRVKEKSLLVTAGVPSTVTAAGLRNAIAWHKRQGAGPKYDEARIRFKSPSGRQQDARLALNDLDAAFTKKEKIEFDSDVEAQQTRLSPTIIAELKTLI